MRWEVDGSRLAAGVRGGPEQGADVVGQHYAEPVGLAGGLSTSVS